MSDTAETPDTIDTTTTPDQPTDSNELLQRIEQQHERITQLETLLASQSSAERGTATSDHHSSARPSAQSPRTSAGASLATSRATACARATATGHRNDILSYMRLRRG